MSMRMARTFLVVAALSAAVDARAQVNASPGAGNAAPKETVTVSGRVSQPGPFPLPRDLLLDELLLGYPKGVLADADVAHVHLHRRDGTQLILDATNDWMLESPLELQLRDGDEITVPALPNTILVLGNVLRPGQHTIVPKQTLRDLLLQPGLLPPNPREVMWFRRDTKPRFHPARRILKRPTRKNNPVLESGDVIFLQFEPERGCTMVSRWWRPDAKPPRYVGLMWPAVLF